MTAPSTTPADGKRFAVSLLARNYIVPWPSPIWWEFRRKEPRRMGFRVTIELDALTAATARADALARVREEMDAKAQNPPEDPYRLEVEGIGISESETPRESAGVKRWFHEE